jgi:hypothetical protein
VNATVAVHTSLKTTQNLMNSVLADMGDADLLVRPVPGANHIAWQLGHLISSEGHLLKDVLPGLAPAELPAGFAQQHGKETQMVDPPKGFLSKSAYVELYNKARGATLAAVDKLSDADLDRPAPGPLVKLAPTLGALLLMVSTHDMMHGGQFSVVRRKLGKPVLF